MQRSLLMTIDRKKVKDNLYQAVNGEWLETAEIDDDKVTAGGFQEVADKVEAILMADTAKMADDVLPLETNEQKEFVKFYKLSHDFDKRNAEGIEPIRPMVDELLAIDSLDDYIAKMPTLILKGLEVPFSFSVSPDMKNATRYALDLDPAPLILPDKTYYDKEQGQELLQVYAQMSEQLLAQLGFDESSAHDYVDKAISFDKLIAPHTLTNEQLADYTKQYNPRTLAEVKAYTSQFDFETVIEQLVGETVDQVIVGQPAYFEAFDRIFTAENFELIKAWTLVLFVNEMTEYLSEDIRQIGSAYGLAISGRPATQSAEKAAYYLAYAQFSEVIGKYYGEKYFGAEAKADVEAMIARMITIYEERLRANDWLSEATIEQAIVKLEALEPLIGYPEEVKPIYHKYKVDTKDSLFANAFRFAELSIRNHFAKWDTEVNRREWGMPASLVNAYFEPTSNVICFPAAILQAPFYDINQTRSENFGGIGAVIAHEISHAFDNNGAKFDEKGNLKNWWTDEDYAEFNKRAQAMIAEFDGVETEAGKVNGTLTVSENIADQGGLTVAYLAMRQEEDADIEAFFYNWARIWCQKARPEYSQLLLNVDVHGPNSLRANIQAQNIDGFHDFFGTQAGDGMYLAPEDRVVIW